MIGELEKVKKNNFPDFDSAPVNTELIEFLIDRIFNWSNIQFFEFSIDGTSSWSNFHLIKYPVFFNFQLIEYPVGKIQSYWHFKTDWINLFLLNNPYLTKWPWSYVL